MSFALPVGAPDKVWVEAELDPGGDVVLTLRDITLRRRYAQERGRHTVTMSQEALQGYGFPMRFFKELKQGYPVQFRMKLSGYEMLLDRGGALGELEAQIGPFPYSIASRRAQQLRDHGARSVSLNREDGGWIVHYVHGLGEIEEGGVVR